MPCSSVVPQGPQTPHLSALKSSWLQNDLEYQGDTTKLDMSHRLAGLAVKHTIPSNLQSTQISLC